MGEQRGDRSGRAVGRRGDDAPTCRVLLGNGGREHRAPLCRRGVARPQGVGLRGCATHATAGQRAVGCESPLDRAAHRVGDTRQQRPHFARAVHDGLVGEGDLGDALALRAADLEELGRGRKGVRDAGGTAAPGHLVAGCHHAVAERVVEPRREHAALRVQCGEAEGVAVVRQGLVDAEDDVAGRVEVDAMTSGEGDRAVVVGIGGAAREQRAIAARRGNPGEAGDDGALGAELASGAREATEQLDPNARRARHEPVGGKLVHEAACCLERGDRLRGRRPWPDAVGLGDVEVHDAQG